MEQETKSSAMSVNPTDAPVADTAQNPTVQQGNQSVAKTKSSRVPAIIGIVIALILLALSGYVWFRSQNEAKTSSAPQTTSEAAKATPASATDVSATTSDIDKSLEDLNEASDFSSTDLSDTSLGL